MDRWGAQRELASPPHTTRASRRACGHAGRDNRPAATRDARAMAGPTSRQSGPQPGQRSRRDARAVDCTPPERVGAARNWRSGMSKAKQPVPDSGSEQILVQNRDLLAAIGGAHAPIIFVDEVATAGRTNTITNLTMVADR